MRRVFTSIATAVISLALSARAADLTVEQAWKQMPTYKVGDSREAWLVLESHIAATSGDAKARQESASRLVGVLGDGTDDAKLFACQQLVRIGGDAHVEEIATLLAGGDVRTVQMACLALAGIGGEAACRELRNAFAKASTETLPDIAHALGGLRDAESVAALVGKLADGTGAVAEAVALALGEIGTAAAGEALLKLGPKPTSVAVTNAQLRCAERLAETTDGKALAQRIGDTLWDAELSAPQRGAVLRSLVVAGHAKAASLVIEAMGADQPRLAGTAANLLPEALASGRVDDVLARFADLAPGTRARVLEVLAENGRREVLPVALQCLQSDDDTIRLAAIRALGLTGDASHVQVLAKLAARATGQVREAAAASLVRLNAKDVDQAVLNGMRRGDDDVREVLVDAAVQRGGDGFLPMLWKLAEEAPVLRKSVFRALGRSAAGADAAKLIGYLKQDLDTGARTALEDAIAAVGRRQDDPQEQLRALSDMWKGDALAEAKASVPRILGRIGGEDALGIVRDALNQDSAELRLEAIRALAAWPDTGAVDGLVKLAEKKDDKIAHTLAVRGLMRLVDQQIGTVPEQLDIVEQLVALSDDAAIADWAKKQRDGMIAGKAGEIALQHVPERSAKRKEELAKSAEKGWRLVAYLDCGPDQRDGAKGKPSLRVTAGKSWFWPGSNRHGDTWAGTIAYTDAAVRVEASTLDPQKSYRVGLTWWDYDGNGRVQSVHLSGKQGLKPTPLPNGKKRQPPAALSVDVPGSAYSSGKLLIEVRRAGASNAVLSEVWLYESDEKPKEADVVEPKPKARDPNAKRILLQTGEDYKGHKWQVTTPVLEEALSEDARLAVDVVDDLTFLRSPKLHEYAAVVMHFKNYDPEVPGREGYDNLASFVEKGGGLVLVHFAGGAFQEFRDDFVKLAGQVWNPELRGHDPFGRFAVNIAKTEHPVTRGMSDFETTDELYTCLEGDTPVTVLASAVSKVDKKAYPMVFVLDYGKGRVLHCVLGHNEGSLSNPPVGKLYRRATAWAAGLEPVK